MNIKPKIVLDGTLYAECGMRGSNRDGMMRVAEDLTASLVAQDENEIWFAGTVRIEKYDRFLKDFVNRNYPGCSKRIISRTPHVFTNVLKYKGLFRTKLSGLPLSFYYRELNDMDVFHSFYYPFPRPLLRNHIKRSLTFHDIIPLKIPGYRPDLVQRTKQIVKSIETDYAISVSEFSRNDLLNFNSRVDPDKIMTIPIAASKKIFFVNNSAAERTRVLEKYSLPDNYFLCISGNDKRKNITHIICSFNLFLLQEKRTDIYLVLAGNGTHSHKMLEELNIDPIVKAKIVIPSVFIDTNDLSAVYSNAVCFFFMSLYEGFGLPALEAMQCGVPVVTSDTTSIPEVVGSGGIQLSPTDQDALCGVMSRMYHDTGLRETYSAAGLKRASDFSWDKTAENYTRFFKKLSEHS